MTKRCVHESDKHICLHEALARDDALARMFGRNPACVLVNNPNRVCSYQEEERDVVSDDPVLDLWRKQ